ncbi:MAG TPA: hypothetical protein VHC94_19055 [Nitrobacter sp.]|nr:hypothetical protein [Nitrobacter sp.]
MFQNLGDGWTTRADRLGGASMPHPHGGFGERNNHKRMKAVIGIAILVALSIGFYEFNAARTITGPATPTVTHPVGQSGR